MVALDEMAKAASLRVLQAELNDFHGVCSKLQGSVEDLRTALQIGHLIAERMGGNPVAHLLARPAASAETAWKSPPESNPLIQQDVVTFPQEPPLVSDSSALGFLETQGFTAVFAAIDRACKAADVEVIGKEKLGGGYVTVVIRGDVAAVHAAIEAGQTEVAGLGTLIAAHVIPRPSQATLGLLP